MIVLSPKPLAVPLGRAFRVPGDDEEARAERKLLRRMDIREALK